MTELGDRIEALHVRVKARQEQSAPPEPVKSRDEVRQELRETMPEVAAFVDRLRKAGFEVKVLAAQENGKTVINREACRRNGVDLSVYEQKG